MAIDKVKEINIFLTKKNFNDFFTFLKLQEKVEIEEVKDVEGLDFFKDVNIEKYDKIINEIDFLLNQFNKFEKKKNFIADFIPERLNIEYKNLETIVNKFDFDSLYKKVFGLVRKNEKITDDIKSLKKEIDKIKPFISLEYEIEKIALKYRDVRDMLYLGRGINMPIAYEGALKMKEISYIHAEAYPAGEMKHGPIALIDKDMPVVAIAPRDPWYEKMVSQIEQAKSRGGSVLMVATEGDERAAELADDVIWIPEVPWMLSPIITVIPLQMLAYHIASLRGLDVDQPRNLAKSVTVE